MQPTRAAGEEAPKHLTFETKIGLEESVDENPSQSPPADSSAGESAPLTSRESRQGPSFCKHPQRASASRGTRSRAFLPSRWAVLAGIGCSDWGGASGDPLNSLRISGAPPRWEHRRLFPRKIDARERCEPSVIPLSDEMRANRPCSIRERNGHKPRVILLWPRQAATMVLLDRSQPQHRSPLGIQHADVETLGGTTLGVVNRSLPPHRSPTFSESLPC